MRDMNELARIMLYELRIMKHRRFARLKDALIPQVLCLVEILLCK
jgi:hypothetical protein